MSNLKISELPQSTPLLGAELFAIVQGGITKQASLNQFHNYVVSYPLEVSPNTVVNLGDAIYDNVLLFRLTFNASGGGSQQMTLNLPDATQNVDRIIRVVSNGGFTSNTQVHLTPINGQTIDGSTNSYNINTSYEGIMVWSDGLEWFIIQKKA